MEKIGVESLFITAAFVKGLDVYTKGLQTAKDKTQDAAMGVVNSGTALGGGIGTAMQAAGAAIGVVGSIMATASAVIVGALAAAGTAVIGFSSLMIKLAIDAKNMENIEFAFARMAGTVGLSLDKMREATRGTVSDDEMLIAANKALLGASAPLAQAFGQDLPRIMELAKVAAKTTGTSYEEALNTIIGAIKRGTTRGLPLLGFTIDMKEATDNLGESMDGVATSAGAQEKQLAILNAIMQQSDAYLSTFAGSSEALSGKMSRSKALFENIKDTLGQFFIPALKTAFDAINRLLEAFDKATQEGGALYNTFVQLAAVFSLVADGFSAGVDMLLGSTTEATDGITDTIANAIDAAFSWGLNLVVNFATGIINGASSVLQGAINFISGMLSGWFSPGSPPRIAPNIDKWGAATMSEFLGGFAKADFDVLKTMQSPLKSILDTLVSGGAMSKVAGKQAFFDISKSMIAGLAGGDLSSVYSQITNAAGTYGVELVKLLKLSVQYATAQKAVAAAEKAVNDAKAKENRLNTNLSLQLMEYNDLARAGASPEVLAAKLAGVNATEDSLIAAQSETKAAEEAKTAADDQLSVIKEQVDLQKSLVDTLIDLAKAHDEVTQAQKEAAKAAAGGGGVPKTETPGKGKGGAGRWGEKITTLQDTINAAIEGAKEALKIKLAEMWQLIQDEINAKLAPALAAFTTKWNELVTLVTPIWESIKTKWAEVTTAIQTKMTELETFLTAWWSRHGSSVTTVFEGIGNTILFYSEYYKSLITGAWTFITDAFEGTGTYLSNIVTTTWEGIKTIVNNNLEGIKQFFILFTENIGNLFDLFAAVFKDDWATAWGEVKQIWLVIVEQIKVLWATALENIKAMVTTAFSNIGDALSAAYTMGQNIIEGIISGVIQKAKDLYWAVRNAIAEAISGGKEEAEEESPSKVFWRMGKNMMVGMAGGVTQTAWMPEAAVRSATAAMAPTMASQPVSTSYRTANVNMGGVNIYNGMGEGELAAAIRRVMRSEMAGV
jgi:phage-related protein